jgi:hypothetical protein
MHTALTRFAHGNSPGWSPYTADERRTIVFDQTPYECTDALAKTPNAFGNSA